MWLLVASYAFLFGLLSGRFYDYFNVYATTIGLSLSFEHSSRLLILGLRFFLYSSGICGEQVPKNVSP